MSDNVDNAGGRNCRCSAFGLGQIWAGGPLVRGRVETEDFGDWNIACCGSALNFIINNTSRNI